MSGLRRGEINSQNKVFSHLQILADLKAGKNPPPITMSLTLTDRCNNKCPRCMEVSGRQPHFPTLKEPKKIIKQVAELGTKGIVFSGGGDPLVYPEAVEVIEYAKSVGLDVGLVTNGLALTPEKADHLVKVCTWIKISLDASCPEEYMITHGMPEKAFRIVLDNIRYAGTHKNGCMVGVAYLTGTATRNGMLPATIMMKEAQVSYINFRPFQGDKDIFDEELKACRALETDEFKVIYKPHKYEKWWEIKTKRCWYQYLYPLIAADGCLYPCCDTRAKQPYNLGNLYEHSLQELWERREDLVTASNFKYCLPNCMGLKVNQLLDYVFEEKIHENFL